MESRQPEEMPLTLSEDVNFVAEDIVNIVSPLPASAMCICNRWFRFQIDTGASCNFIQREDLTCFRDEVTLCKTGRVLRLYDGAVVKPERICMPAVENTRNKLCYNLDFVVVR